MDPEVVGVALTPAALAPPIAQTLGLPAKSVTAALMLLADGAQPAFVARYRPERVDELTIRDLERIQAEAAHAVAFEFKRQDVVSEVRRRKMDQPHVIEHLRHSTHIVDLEDVRKIGRAHV